MRLSFAIYLAIVTAVLGFVVGRRGASDGGETPSPDVAAQAAALQSATELDALRKKLAAIERDLKSFALVDLDEYLRIQDAEARAQKLSTLLGELFVVLLNHALMAPPAEQETVMRQLGSGEPRDSGSSEAAADAPAAGQTGDAPGGPTDNAAPAAEPGAPTSSRPGAAWREAETGLDRVTLANADDFLAKAAIPDLRAELRNGRPFQKDDPRLASLQGLFSGEVTFLDGKEGPLTVELETAATEVEGGRIKGSYSVRTYKNGERTGNSNSNGTLDGIMNTSGASSALIVETGPERFMQLYYLPGQDAMIGNFYEMSTAKDSKLIGRVRLSR